MVAGIGVGLFFLLLILGAPVAFALLSAGAIGLFLLDVNSMFSILTTTPYRTAASFTLTTIPLFILMAETLSRGGFAKDLYRACYVWIGHLPGGLAISSVMASAFMGTMSGSTTATAAALSRIAVPEMDRYGYDRRISTAAIAYGGTIAVMIPPSIPMIVYGILTETSIGKLLIAGIIPGILLTIILSFGIYLKGKRNPDLAPTVESYSWKERFRSLSSLWAVLVIVFLVIVTIYTGFATATEAAALGAAGAAIIGFSTRRLNVKSFIESVKNAIKTTAMIFTIIIGAMVFGYFLTITGTSQAIVNSMTALPLPDFGILLMILLIYGLMGFFMDQLAIKLIMVPLVFPIIVELGYDPIWFGVLLLVVAEMGMVTPPMGMNVFVVSSVTKEPLETIFKGVFYMLLWGLFALAILLAFPELSTWLPSIMKT